MSTFDLVRASKLAQFLPFMILPCGGVLVLGPVNRGPAQDFDTRAAMVQRHEEYHHKQAYNYLNSGETEDAAEAGAILSATESRLVQIQALRRTLAQTPCGSFIVPEQLVRIMFSDSDLNVD